MSREEATALLALLEKTALEFSTIAYLIGTRLSEYPGWSSSSSFDTMCSYLMHNMGFNAMELQESILSQLRRALEDPQTSFKPYDPREFWTGKVGIKRLREPQIPSRRRHA